MDLMKRRGMMLSAPHLERAFGSIASFNTNYPYKLKKMIVGIDSVQDLHGYDAPYHPGYRYNIYDPSTRTEGSYINSSGVIASAAAACISDFIPVTAGKSYTWTGVSGETGDNNKRVCGYNSSKSGAQVINSVAVSGQGISYTNEFTVPNGLAYIRISLNKTDTDVIVSDDEQTLAGNICPISGWAGAHIEQAQFNLFDSNSTVYKGYLKNNTWIYSSDSSSIVVSCRPNTAYFIHVNGTPPGILRAGATSSDPPTTPTASWSKITLETDCVISSDGNISYTTGNNVRWLIIQMSSSGFNTFKENLCVSISDPLKNGTYEPYNGDAYDITFPDGTVYGGTLDVVNKKLTVDKIAYIATGTGSSATDGMRFYKSSNTARNEFYTLASNNGIVVPSQTSTDEVICSHFKTAAPSNSAISCFVGSSQFRVAFPLGGDIETTTQMNNWVAEQYANGTPLTYVLTLSTPTVYDLTADEITTLLGTNNIWADCGDVDVTFYKT